MKLIFLTVMVSLLLIPVCTTYGQENEKLLAVLNFKSMATHYVWGIYSNYFQAGDTVNLEGIVMVTNSWNTIPQVHGKVTIVGPDGSTVYQKDVVTDTSGKFDVSLPITSDFKVGKYLASVQVSSQSYQNIDNEYMTVFYVLRAHDYIVNSQGKQFPVKIGSIDYDTSDIGFDPQKNLITFDLKKVPGNYTSDGELGYVGGNIFMTIPKSFIQGSFFYKLNGVGPDWTAWLGNETDSAVQITPGDVWPAGAQDVQVSVGTHEMSAEN